MYKGSPGHRTALFNTVRARSPLFLRRRLFRDEDAISYIIEFFAAMIVFIVILTAYFLAIDTQFSTPDSTDRTEVTTIMRVLDSLTGSQGRAGNTTSWERLGPDELNGNLSNLGFALAPSNSGQAGSNTSVNLSLSHGVNVLCAAKIGALRNVSYLTLKDLFVLEHREFAIQVSPMEMTTLSPEQQDLLTIRFGVNISHSVKRNTVERLFTVSFHNVDDPQIPIQANYSIVSIKVTILEGVVEYPKVYISELNYAPYSGDSEEEWVELYNGNDAAVDLTHWTFTVDGETRELVLYRGSAILPGGGRALICADPQITLDIYPVDPNASVFAIETGIFGIDGLPDEGGSLTLEGIFVYDDILEYDTITGGGSETRQTLERVSIHQTVFRESDVDYGTPGY